MAENGAPARAFRIGIDVGGTFTKAVLIDNATREVVGRYAVLTTHDHPRGVAAGVVEVFHNVLDTSGVAANEVVFLAHSTTQATNALLEGDVAKVGIVGMAGAAAAKLAREQARIDAIALAPGRRLETANRFLVSDDLSPDEIKQAVAELAAEGAEVLVASSAFGVDNTASEEMVREIGNAAGLLTTCGYEITRLYGLTTRTRTAVLNASILPRMNATANMTEESVRETGITAPLMIMRGDGGVMDIREMRRRPAITMLSGPAASVAGALMHLRVSDGLYFEVGGTSTNIGVIRDGRPTVTYASVGGHETYVSSLDVRVLGIAGGSLVRVRDGSVHDVGPRSAHIAGLAYAAFAAPEDMVEPRIEFFEPKPGDGADYVVVQVAGGKRFALTTTCAANVLGYAKPGMHAHGNPQAARLAFAALGQAIGSSPEAAARAVLDCATDKVIPVVEQLAKEYRLDPDQCLLIGEGGGAASLVPYTAERADLKFEISKDAEVISSIGVALALVRDVIERVVPHPKPEDLQAIREEALAAVVRLGAHRSSVDVTIEIDPQTHRVRATAIGAAEMHVKDESGAIGESEARAIAARSMDVAAGTVRLAADAGPIRIYQKDEPAPAPTRIIDGSGAVRIRRHAATVEVTTAAEIDRAISAFWARLGPAAAAGPGTRTLLLVFGIHIVDLSGVESEQQATALAHSALAENGDGDVGTDRVVALVEAWA
jgi:N-methylhydantoinase A